MLWVVDVRRDSCPECTDDGDVAWKFGVHFRHVVDGEPGDEFLCLFHLTRLFQDKYRATGRDPELRGELNRALAGDVITRSRVPDDGE